jgi:hypothetical protein
VPEGESSDCIEEAGSPHAIDPEAPNSPSQQSKSASETKPAKRVKAKTARSGPLPSFLRSLDLFPSARR